MAAQASQVCQISSALQLPSQSKSTRKRSRDSLVELVAVAEAMAPTCSKRSRQHIDDVLLSNKEVPGARRAYRMSQSLLLDYDTEWDALVNDNRL